MVNLFCFIIMCCCVFFCKVVVFFCKVVVLFLGGLKRKRLTRGVNLFFLLSHEDSNLDRQNQNL